MKATLAIEWFLNPDHLPFIVGIREGIFKKK
jgi:ABC-type nitrate/sulfonate/bicarbonate transport system substrate-binding protein